MGEAEGQWQLSAVRSERGSRERSLDRHGNRIFLADIPGHFSGTLASFVLVLCVPGREHGERNWKTGGGMTITITCR